VSLDYARLLTEHSAFSWTCAHRARSDLPCVATLGDWYLLIWPIRTPPRGQLSTVVNTAMGTSPLPRVGVM